MTAPLLSVDRVTMTFPLGRGLAGRRRVHALREVSLEVATGESVGVVGESGSGKSTLARCVIGLLRSDSGAIRFDGREIGGLGWRAMRALRAQMQIVFQDSTGSLHPLMTVGRLVAEPLRLLGSAARAECDARVESALREVGLDRTFLPRRAHQLSGGQRQRVSIARALVLRPRFLICDEAVSALDVSIQAQIVDLLRTLRADHRLTMLFISHDLGVVRQVCDRVVVMYFGAVVETGPVEDVLAAPLHPYTRALVDSVPEIRRDRAGAPGAAIAGNLPSALAPPAGCGFHSRCPIATDACRSLPPRLLAAGDGRAVACHAVHPPQPVRGDPP